MPVPWDAVVSGSAGIIGALVGVTTGALLTRRAQTSHWSRDKQVDACTAIIVESTRVQLALRRQWQNKQQRIGWGAVERGPCEDLARQRARGCRGRRRYGRDVLAPR
jgi:hypothetical protein